MQFKGQVDGFQGHFANCDELKSWVRGLVARYPDLLGKTCRVWKATWIASDGSGAQYSMKPSHYREIVIGA